VKLHSGLQVESRLGLPPPPDNHPDLLRRRGTAARQDTDDCRVKRIYPSHSPPGLAAPSQRGNIAFQAFTLQHIIFDKLRPCQVENSDSPAYDPLVILIAVFRQSSAALCNLP